MERVYGVIATFLFATLAVLAVVVIVRENVAATDTTSAEDGTVVMANIAFSPAELTVRPGTKVVFDNQDVAPHTVTADDGSTDSGLISPGKAFELVVGEGFTYHCELHPSMKAKIELEA